MPHWQPQGLRLRPDMNKADGVGHPSALLNRSVHSFPNMGGDAVSGITHSPTPVVSTVGKAGRRKNRFTRLLYHFICTIPFYHSGNIPDDSNPHFHGCNWLLRQSRGKTAIRSPSLMVEPSGIIVSELAVAMEESMPSFSARLSVTRYSPSTWVK